ncbi:MAG: hypothetical protein NC548_31940 [Lachnospiraceae bacterium]|nr:hypothetical protein [Lachnospiraceae bacterium]MCM1230491.1 hypothetical protein [Ruminococcus flavefaciens]
MLNQKRLPSKFDCRYSFWINGISQNKYPEVYNRIIVVGAVDYKLNVAACSDGGDRVDIYALGEEDSGENTNVENGGILCYVVDAITKIIKYQMPALP